MTDEEASARRQQVMLGEDLVRALEQIPVLGHDAGRAALVDRLTDQHGQLSLRDQPTPRLFFIELVRWCLRTPAALRLLADAVRFVAPGEAGADQVSRIVDGRSGGRAPTPRLPPEGRAEHLPDRLPAQLPEQLPDQLPARSRAVLIGCASYPRPASRLTPLPAVDANLRELERLLRDPAGLGLDDDRLTVVADPSDADAVLTPLVDAASCQDDLLLVYYAGHGILVDGELRLGLAGSTAQTAGWTGLDPRFLRHEVHRALATTKVLIVDCCYSGRLTSTLTDPGSVIESQWDVAGTVTLASSAADSVSYAPPGEQFTAFTGELLTVLRDGLPGQGPVLTVDRVFTAVRGRLRGRGLPEPRMLHSDRAAQVALARNRAGRG